MQACRTLRRVLLLHLSPPSLPAHACPTPPHPTAPHPAWRPCPPPSSFLPGLCLALALPPLLTDDEVRSSALQLPLPRPRRPGGSIRATPPSTPTAPTPRPRRLLPLLFQAVLTRPKGGGAAAAGHCWAGCASCTPPSRTPGSARAPRAPSHVPGKGRAGRQGKVGLWSRCGRHGRERPCTALPALNGQSTCPAREAAPGGRVGETLLRSGSGGRQASRDVTARCERMAVGTAGIHCRTSRLHGATREDAELRATSPLARAAGTSA